MTPRPSLTPENRKRYSGKKISVFAINLQAKRKEVGITQGELGERIGISKSHVSQYEAGVFPTTPERIVALADALGCTCDELLRPKKENK